jgi:hypothetical protein
MKKILWLILIVLNTYSFGQSENLKTKALTFSFNGLNLSEFYGGIGGKLWVSDFFALNANIGLDSRTNTTGGNDRRTEGKEKLKTLVFGFGIEKHFQGMENLEPYWMGRIQGSYSERDYNPSLITGYMPWGNRSIMRTISAETGFGIEYWLTNKISLAGQHLFRFYYGTGSTTIYEDNTTQKSIERGFDTGTSSIILAIYF